MILYSLIVLRIYVKFDIAVTFIVRVVVIVDGVFVKRVDAEKGGVPRARLAV